VLGPEAKTKTSYARSMPIAMMMVLRHLRYFMRVAE
jgi:hypothetical protein